MCKSCGTDCRGADTKVYLAVGAMLAAVAPAAAKATTGFAQINADANVETQAEDDAKGEVSDEFLTGLNERQSVLVRAAYDSVPIPDLEEAIIQCRWFADKFVEQRKSLANYLRLRYEEGNREMGEVAQEAIAQRIELENALRAVGHAIPSFVIPGSPAGVTS